MKPSEIVTHFRILCFVRSAFLTWAWNNYETSALKTIFFISVHGQLLRENQVDVTNQNFIHFQI